MQKYSLQAIGFVPENPRKYFFMCSIVPILQYALVIVVPESIVNDLGWKEKVELEARARQGKLVIEKK